MIQKESESYIDGMPLIPRNRKERREFEKRKKKAAKRAAEEIKKHYKRWEAKQ